MALLAIQPALGILHHQHYLKTQSRGLISYVHIWWGRILMVLGVVNGGLGLQLAQESNGPIIAYSVVAAVVFLAYAGYKSLAFLRSGKGTAAGANKEVNARVPRVAADEYI